ncbi:MAG: G5 domain-containing protein [Clostridia bacterium]|nr:G5 domain-containing protein [Clostridia bacterium]
MKEQLLGCLAFFKRHAAVFIAIGLGVLSALMLLGMTLSLRSVTVNDDGKKLTVLTFSHDRESILASAGITLQSQDVVTSSASEIEINRAFHVTVAVDGGDSTTLCVTEGTVADALKSAQINTVTHTLAKYAPEDTLTANMVIDVKPLENTTRTETEEIAHETVLTFSEDLPAGSRSTQQKGVAGEKTIVYRDYFKDGKLVETEIVSETVTREPVTELATVGAGALSTPPETLSIDANGVPQKYKQVLTGTACAYTAGEGARTSTGTIPAVGTVAVNPKVIPYGSKLFIVSERGYVYGYGVASDTGGGVLKNLILADLYMDTAKECFQFGRQQVTIYVLE